MNDRIDRRASRKGPIKRSRYGSYTGR